MRYSLIAISALIALIGNSKNDDQNLGKS